MLRSFWVFSLYFGISKSNIDCLLDQARWKYFIHLKLAWNMYGLAPIEDHIHHPQPPRSSHTKALASISLRPLWGKSKIKCWQPPLYGYQNDHLLMLIAAMYDKWGLSMIKYPKLPKTSIWGWCRYPSIDT